ncbi:MAG: DUF4903 family protein [Prevotellaceae bacterium]|nr:DUF4903 domain-containing protein [Prevotella sp.]MDD7256772.1 DUF4903 family protein [Prevotellaceae bacterium]
MIRPNITLLKHTPAKIFLLGSIALFTCSLFSSCSGDEENGKNPIESNLILKAKEILKDSIVVRSKAMMGPVDKTLLPEGCPLKYHFSWDLKSETPLNIKLKNFSVGNMPVQVWFNIYCRLIPLNSWEKDEYKGDGWIKFTGVNGDVTYTPNQHDVNDEYTDGKGGAGTVIGYLNVNTKQIEFSTNFNVMLMQSFVFLQTIDYSKMDTYEADLAKYEEDLKAYKKEHGL